MLKIRKITSASPIDYAAEELKKYLRMMMPEGGDISISYDPEAKDGFRLGLMQDFGLDVSDAEDTELDDILYIDCDTYGGIIAGDNPRSVLLSVYEYLRQNGCRWLFPGVDGEYIPMRDIAPVRYRHKPTMRYRGWCNEGTEFQQCMLDAIELAPKLGLNVFMLEFRIPSGYYTRYYDHKFNDNNRAPEPITMDTITQWKVQCEAEIARRGLQFHNIGHGWTVESFNIPGTERYDIIVDDSIIPDDKKDIFAMLGGKRGFNKGKPINTNYCMSNRRARKMVTDAVVDYARLHSNTDYLHVWLSDGTRCHCECDECRKKTPSDWYMIQLNEIDEELTRQGLRTRIVFISYVDTTWAPMTDTIKNPDRFTLLIAPITRSYTETLPKEPSGVKTVPFELNKIKLPTSLEEYLLYFDEWKKVWSGSSISYEYHFWRQHYYELSGIYLARRIVEDVRVYKEKGLDGIIEDASQRGFFPTGLAFYTYARSQFDSSLSADEILEDYFSHAFGEDWRDFRDYLLEIADTVDYEYITKKKSADEKISPLYNPLHARELEKIPEIVERGRALIKKHYNSNYRIQTVSVRLLEHHADFVLKYAEAMVRKALGDDEGCKKHFEELVDMMGKKEVAIQSYFDFGQSVFALQQIYLFTQTNKEYLDTQDW